MTLTQKQIQENRNQLYVTTCIILIVLNLFIFAFQLIEFFNNNSQEELEQIKEYPNEVFEEIKVYSPVAEEGVCKPNLNHTAICCTFEKLKDITGGTCIYF